VAAAIGLHLLAVLAFFMAGYFSSENRYKPLGVMEFAYYDPEGGTPGGEGVEPSTGPSPGPGEPMPVGRPEESAAPEQTETSAAPPEPETVLVEETPEPAPEPAETKLADTKPSDLPGVVTSTAEEAAPLPPQPPAEEEAEPKPPPKPRPKPAPKPAEPSPPKSAPAAQAEAGTVGGAGGGTLAGEAGTGGGIGTGRSGLGGGTGMGNPNALNAYTAQIRAKLNRFKKYPPAAVVNKITGMVTINFTVNRQGEVISSRVVRSSGHSILDEEAMALLRRCNPFPPIPKKVPQTTINLTVPINFSPPRI
jgi:protein TonB